MFRGTYYKHQANGNTVCLIVGKAGSGKFLQVLTGDKVYFFEDYSKCSFSKEGVLLDLPDIKGKISYSNLTPLKSDIMGFFRFFPMQCRHSILSMRHDLAGEISFKGKPINFNGGIGYIEGDSGRSFPKNYLWIHCNDFKVKSSISVSVADIPFLGFHFQGCICAITHEDREYRLATYNGVKIQEKSQKRLVLIQKDLRLEIDIDGQNFLPLKMPVNGRMNAVVNESNSANARFKFFVKDKLLFDIYSSNASFEYNY